MSRSGRGWTIPVARRYVDDLCRHLPDFVRAYEPDGLAVTEFDAFPPTVRTLRAFIASYHELLDRGRRRGPPEPRQTRLTGDPVRPPSNRSRLDGPVPVHRFGRRPALRGRPRPGRRGGLPVDRDRRRRPVPGAAPSTRRAPRRPDQATRLRRRVQLARPDASRRSTARPGRSIRSEARSRSGSSGTRSGWRASWASRPSCPCPGPRATAPGRPPSTGSSTRGPTTPCGCWSANGRSRSRSGRRWPGTPPRPGSATSRSSSIRSTSSSTCRRWCGCARRSDRSSARTSIRPTCSGRGWIRWPWSPRSARRSSTSTSRTPRCRRIAWRSPGVLDTTSFDDARERAWVFRTVGRAHDRAWWASFIEALRAVGYDGALSIENEDPYQSAVDGVREAAAFSLPLIG